MSPFCICSVLSWSLEYLFMMISIFEDLVGLASIGQIRSIVGRSKFMEVKRLENAFYYHAQIPSATTATG